MYIIIYQHSTFVNNILFVICPDSFLYYRDIGQNMYYYISAVVLYK